MEDFYSLWLRIKGSLVEVEMSEPDVEALERQIALARARKKALEAQKRSRESDRDGAAEVLQVR